MIGKQAHLDRTFSQDILRVDPFGGVVEGIKSDSEPLIVPG